jgi:hypothetical protein
MKIGDRYVFGLCIAAAVIVIPGGTARVFGASIHVLAFIAMIQLYQSPLGFRL